MSKLENLAGQKFNFLTIIEYREHKGHSPYWLCKCDCGKEKIVRASHLKDGTTKSCGCYRIQQRKDELIDLTGQKFGKLTALYFCKRRKAESLWMWKCECGNEKIIAAGNIKNGSTISCGCHAKIASIKHGQSGKTSEYAIWQGVKARCLNPNSKAYKRYGGRGIMIDPNWLGEHGFENFFADMGERPSLEYSIERINNDEGYNKKNCTWLLRRLQAKNTGRSVWLTYNGKEMILADWGRLWGVYGETIGYHLKHGVPFELIAAKYELKNQLDTINKKYSVLVT